MGADTGGFPLLPQGRGLEGAWPPPTAQQAPAQLVQAWGLTGQPSGVRAMRKGLQEVLHGT